MAGPNDYYTKDKWSPVSQGALVVDTSSLPILNPGDFVPVFMDKNTGQILTSSQGGGGGSSSGTVSAAGVNGSLAQAIQGINGGVPVPITAAALPNPTGAPTLVNQNSEVTLLNSIELLLSTGVLQVNADGLTSANAGQNVSIAWDGSGRPITVTKSGPGMTTTTKTITWNNLNQPTNVATTT